MKCLNRNGINGDVKKKLWVRLRVRFSRVWEVKKWSNLESLGYWEEWSVE